jgi:hypothetical protein
MGGKVDFVCLVATILSRDGIVVIKFTKPRKLPHHFFTFYCSRHFWYNTWPDHGVPRDLRTGEINCYALLSV